MLALLPPDDGDGIIDLAMALQFRDDRAAAVVLLVAQWSSLSKAQQDRVFGAVLSFDLLDTDKPFLALVRRVSDLSEEQRDSLIDFADKQGYGLIRAWALSTLAAKMSEFSKPQHARIVDAVRSIDDDGDQAGAFDGLGRGMAALDTTEQLKCIVDAGCGFRDDKAVGTAIRGLARGLSVLSTPMLDQLVNTTAALPDGVGKSRAIAGLGAAMDSLTEAHGDCLVDAADQLTEADGLADALVGLAAGAAHLSDGARANVARLAQRLTDDRKKAKVLASLLLNSLQAQSAAGEPQ